MIRSIVSKIRRKLGLPTNQQGQGLTELAVITPILLLFFLGLVEVGGALHSYSAVTSGAREGARYGIRHSGVRGGDESADIAYESIAYWTRSVADSLPITTVSEGETLELDGEKATIIVSHLKEMYSSTRGHYVYHLVNQYSEGGDRPSMITEDWLATTAQRSDDTPGLPHETTNDIAVEVIYDHPQLTGLFAIVLPDPIPLHSITVMRIFGDAMDRCDAYPIAIHESSLDGAKPGDSIGDMFNGTDSGNFGWMRWPADSSYGTPGQMANWLGEDSEESGSEFSNACDSEDETLSVDDCVWGNSGLTNSVDIRAALDALIGQEIVVPVWDWAEGTGINAYYHIVRFVRVMITDYHLPGQNRITATYIGPATECSGLTTP